MKNLVAILIISVLTACCGVSSSSDSRVAATTVTISGVNTATTLNKTVEYSVDVSGESNNVVISGGNTVNQLLVSGENNDITIEKMAVVKSINMSDNSNNLYVPVGFRAQVLNTGLQNAVIEK